MDRVNYLKVFRYRWPLLLMATGVGLLMSWLTLPPAPQEGVPRAQSYEATATVITSPSNPKPLTMSTVALYTTAGEVPVRAAERLDYDGEPQVLASTIETAVGEDQRTLTISTTSTDGPLAARTVNAFAEELVAHFTNDESTSPEGQLDNVTESLRNISDRIERLDRQIADRPKATQLVAERDGLQTQYQALSAQAATLRSEVTGAAPLTLLQRAIAIPATDEGVFQAPTSGPARMLLGGLIGLLLGLVLALLVERADSRIRTREDAEEAFDLPVLAEVPRLPRSRRGQHVILSAVEPGSATAEAHRALRSTLLLLRPGDPTEGGRQAPTEPSPLLRGTTLLVTSPRPSEGKTTTVANLAVVLAESGRKVLILSLDLRNSEIQDYFGIPEISGLSDILYAGRPQDLENVIRETEYPGVRIAPGGRELAHAGGLLAGVKPLLEHARQLADVVLVDSPPILTVSDALEISPHVDAALVVSRAGRTTRAQAVATHRLMSRLGVPALGTVLVAAEEVPGSYRYGYGYGYGKSRSRRAEKSPDAVAQEPVEEESPVRMELERLTTRLSRGEVALAVVGQGYVGLSLSCAAAVDGLDTLGIDIAKDRIASLAAGTNTVPGVDDVVFSSAFHSGRLRFSTEFDAVTDADVVVICVPTPITDHTPDLTAVRDAGREVGARLRRGQLVILESTTYPGTTEQVLKPLLESSGLRCGHDFLLAFSPERIDPGNTKFGLRNTPRVVGGLGPDATAAVAAFYRLVVDDVTELSGARAAELAKLLENTFRSVNIALVNELAMLCHDQGIDVWEVIRAADTKPFGFMPFYPGPGVGGHCIPLDPTYLAWQSYRDTGRRFRLVELAQDINAGMPDFVTRRIIDTLGERGVALRDAKVLALGVTYKPDVGDLRESAAVETLAQLVRRGVQVTFHDPFVARLDSHGLRLKRTRLSPAALEAVDAVAVLTPHESYDFDLVRRHAKLIFDARNALGVRGDPAVVTL